MNRKLKLTPESYSACRLLATIRTKSGFYDILGDMGTV